MALIGIHELAQTLGVGRARADTISRKEGFPEPKVRHARIRLWEDAEVIDWIRVNRPGTLPEPPQEPDDTPTAE